MFTFLQGRCATLASIAIAVGGASAVSAAPAQAAAPSPSSCPAVSATQPFSAWGDTNSYYLIGGGDFTAGAPGWTFSGGASIVSGGDPFDLTGTPSQVSLSLPAGATATSPVTCVDVSQPTFRMLDVAGAPLSSVLVSVQYTVGAGTISAPVGLITASGAWRPSPIFQDGSGLAASLQGGTAQMAISLTSLTGTTQVNDVFVDPRQGWS